MFRAEIFCKKCPQIKSNQGKSHYIEVNPASVWPLSKYSIRKSINWVLKRPDICVSSDFKTQVNQEFYFIYEEIPGILYK